MFVNQEIAAIATTVADGGMKSGAKRKKEPKTNNHFYVINGQLLIKYYTIFQVGSHFFIRRSFYLYAALLAKRTWHEISMSGLARSDRATSSFLCTLGQYLLTANSKHAVIDGQ